MAATVGIHSDDDQVVSTDIASRRSVKLVPNGTLKVYPGAPHAIPDTHKDQLNVDLLVFLQT